MDAADFEQENAETERGKFNLSLWRLKNCTFGWMKWEVRRYSEEQRVWQLVEHKAVVSTYDAAIQEARSALAFWSLRYEEGGAVVSRVAKL